MIVNTKTKFTLDTEFHDKGHNNIDLLSVGVVGEDGSTYYAVVSDIDWKAVNTNTWLRDNVVSALPDPRFSRKIVPWRTRLEIKSDLIEFFKPYESPQFWAYFADWDWILFCHIFGNLLELGNFIKDAPMLCLDIKQEMKRLQIPREALTNQYTVEHNALNDAEWDMQILREVALIERKRYGTSWINF